MGRQPMGEGAGERRREICFVPVSVRRKKVAGIGRCRYDLTSDDTTRYEFEGPADLDLKPGRPVTLSWRNGRVDWLESAGKRRHMQERTGPEPKMPRSWRRWPWFAAWWLATAALVFLAWLLDEFGFPAG